jgi:hypothetical protein
VDTILLPVHGLVMTRSESKKKCCVHLFLGHPVKSRKTPNVQDASFVHGNVTSYDTAAPLPVFVVFSYCGPQLNA